MFQSDLFERRSVLIGTYVVGSVPSSRLAGKVAPHARHQQTAAEHIYDVHSRDSAKQQLLQCDKRCRSHLSQLSTALKGLRTFVCSANPCCHSAERVAKADARSMQHFPKCRQQTLCRLRQCFMVCNCQAAVVKRFRRHQITICSRSQTRRLAYKARPTETCYCHL